MNQDAKWFSSKLRFAIMVESEGAKTLNDRIFVFKAKDFSSAFERAIEIGESGEEAYKNLFDQSVT